MDQAAVPIRLLRPTTVRARQNIHQVVRNIRLQVQEEQEIILQVVPNIHRHRPNILLVDIMMEEPIIRRVLLNTVQVLPNTAQARRNTHLPVLNIVPVALNIHQLVPPAQYTRQVVLSIRHQPVQPTMLDHRIIVLLHRVETLPMEAIALTNMLLRRVVRLGLVLEVPHQLIRQLVQITIRLVQAILLRVRIILLLQRSLLQEIHKAESITHRPVQVEDTIITAQHHRFTLPTDLLTMNPITAQPAQLTHRISVKLIRLTSTPTTELNTVQVHHSTAQPVRNIRRLVQNTVHPVLVRLLRVVVSIAHIRRVEWIRMLRRRLKRVIIIVPLVRNMMILVILIKKIIIIKL